jgi:hypothetical protein
MGKSKTVDLTDQFRADGWSNLVTSIGTGNDKRLQNQIFWDQRSPEFYEQLYTGDEIASRIVNVIPEEALRRGWEWTQVDKEVQVAINKKAQDLNLKGAIEKTWKWGRAYGGACLYIVTDTDDPASPLRLGERVIGLRDLSRYDLRILTTDVETDFGNPNWGHPRIYYLVVQMGSQFKGYPIHWTRMVRFDGYLVPRRTFIRNNYWHDSVLNRLFNAIRNYQSSNDAVASILQDFNVDVYKMKNLANLIAAGKESVVKSRIEMIQYSKSVIRAMMLDADDEEYENVGRSIEGVGDLLTKQANRLVAATDIPHTKLLGESPDGSNATGNSTTSQWYDHIQSEQENYLRPKLRRLIDAIFYDIPDLEFKFRPLQQLTDLEHAELRNKQAQTDQIYISTGVLDPSEVADSRFGGDEYSTETKLDEEAREQGLIGAGSGMAPDLFSDPDVSSDLGENIPGQPEIDQAGLGQGSPMYQPEGKPSFAENAFNPSTEAYEKAKEQVALPESVQEFTPNPKGVETQNPGTQFNFRNQEVDIPEKKKPFISQSMSEPMRDPKTNPKIKPGGHPNQPRIIEPTRGNGIIASSGSEYKADAGESMMMPRQADYVKQDAPGLPIQQVSVVALLTDNSILLGKRRDSGKWVMPGGLKEGSETPQECASRELLEETGISIPPEKMNYVGSSMDGVDGQLFQVDLFCVSTSDELTADGSKDPDQEISVWKWINISKGLPDDVNENLHHRNDEPFTRLGLI